MSGSPAPGSVVAQIVTAMRTLAGPHPGFRPGAPHLQGQSVPAIIRFANAAGDPAVHDDVANVRSLDLSADPIVVVRSAAYALSYERHARGE